MSDPTVVDAPQTVPDDPADCPACAEHEQGFCWTHKCRHMRSRGTSNGMIIPAHFKASVTQREIMRDMDDSAFATGKGIIKAR